MRRNRRCRLQSVLPAIILLRRLEKGFGLETGKPEMTPVVADIDQLNIAISHATAPAFMLGAVAGFLTILIARLERVAERKRALRSPDSGAIDSTAGESMAGAYARRMALLGRAIVFAVLSALVTAALLIMAFLIALVGLGHGKVVAMMFVAALALLMASLVELTREIRLQINTMRLD